MALPAETLIAPQASPQLTRQQAITRIVFMLMAAAGIRHQKALAEPLGITSSGVSEKVNGKRDWTFDDADALVAFFTPLVPGGVYPGIFLEDPNVVAARLSAIGYKLEDAGEPPDLTIHDGKRRGPKKPSLPFLSSV